MKTVQYLVAAFLMAGAFANAQLSVNVNVGTPPAWGLAGYTDVRYYYIPDLATYYDVSTGQYIYVSNGKWTRAAALPVAYRSYNLHNGYKVVLNDYRGATPYVYYKTHKIKYPKGYHPGVQKTIGLPPGQAKKATVVRTPAGDAVVVRKPGKGPGHGKGHGHGHGKGKH